jgi:hypothetical protein
VDIAAPTPVWRVLLGYLRPHRVALVGGGLLSLVTGATGLALPLVARELIGALSGGASVTGPLLAMTARSGPSAATCCNAPPSRWCSPPGAGW